MEPAIKKISDEFSKGHFTFTYPHMADEIVWNVLGANTVKGKENVIAYCDKMLIEMAGSSLNNSHHITSDDCVAVQGYCTYINQDNKPGKTAYCDVYRFENEKLIEITSYCIEIKMK